MPTGSTRLVPEREWIRTELTSQLRRADHSSPCSSQQTAMKNALRKGTAKDLNVYSVGEPIFCLGRGAQSMPPTVD